MAPTSERSVAGVIGDVVGNIQQLLRAEIRLAKAEAGAELAGLWRGVIWCAVAAASAIFGVSYVLLAVVHTLALWMPLWAAALLVGVVMLGVAAAAAAVGVKALKVQMLPRTTQSLKENLTWTRT